VKCKFCGSHLSSPKSLAVGYGLDCAIKHGLPWGDRVRRPRSRFHGARVAAAPPPPPLKRRPVPDDWRERLQRHLARGRTPWGS